MLQQILKDMYIDPDVLNALNEDQKKTLFLKMRQEQVRRWKEREEKLEQEEQEEEEEEEEHKRTKPRKAHSKSVSWLLGRDGDVSVLVINDVDELTSKFICSGRGDNNLQTMMKSSDVVNSEREKLVCGRSVTMKDKQEVTNTSLPLLVSVSERSSSSQQLSICSSVSPASVGVADLRRSITTHCGTTTDARREPCSKEPRQESHDVAASEAPGRAAAASDGAGASGRGRVAQLMKTFSVDGGAQNQGRGIKPPLPAKPNHLRTTGTPTVR